MMSRALWVPTLALSICGGTLPALAQGTDPQNYRLVVQVPRREINEWLREEFARSGGNLERGRYHFVVGFSTGHYGSDPVQAIATHRLAFTLLNNSFAAGDRVTPFAWEMELWNEGPTIELTHDPATRRSFVNAIPYAPKENSQGGHDTERALYEALTRIVSPKQAGSTIVLLLTNTNQSQGPVGSRSALFGANNQQLAAAIERLGFRAPVRHSFSASTQQERLTVDATALFPKKLTPLLGTTDRARFPTFPLESWVPDADRPEPAELPNLAARSSDGKVAPPPPPDPQWGPWPILLAVAGGVALFAWWLPRRQKPIPSPTSPRAKHAPAGRPLPGSIRATIGAAPTDQKVTLQKLTSTSQWHLTRAADGSVSLVENPESGAAVLAVLSFGRSSILQLTAEGDSRFHRIQGVSTEGCSSSLLVLRLGHLVKCQIVSATSPEKPIPLILEYVKESK